MVFIFRTKEGCIIRDFVLSSICSDLDGNILPLFIYSQRDVASCFNIEWQGDSTQFIVVN